VKLCNVYIYVSQMLAVLLFRYVQTSTDIALSWSDPTLICPGYLFNLIGAPPKPLNKTTNIEEFQRQQEKLEETIVMDADSKSTRTEEHAGPPNFC